MSQLDLEAVLTRLEARLEAMDKKLDSLSMSRRKSMEWIGQLSEHISSLDGFREEVRATLEPLYAKLEGVEDNLRVLGHATSDVSRRMDGLDGVRGSKRGAG